MIDRLIACILSLVWLENRFFLNNSLKNYFLKNQTKLVDIDILADKDFVMYELEVDNSKTIMSNVDLEQIKRTLFLAFEGMNVAVVNNKNAQNQIPIFLRLDDTKNLLNSSKESLKSKLQTLKVINNNGMMVNISEFVKIKESIKYSLLFY